MKWKYEKAEGHHHVIISKDEVLDVDTEDNARLIAKAPEMCELLELFAQRALQTGAKHTYKVIIKALP